MEQQKQSLKKAAELERRFATKDGAGPDGAADGTAASSDSDSDQDDEDKITETEEAGECGLQTLRYACECGLQTLRYACD